MGRLYGSKDLKKRKVRSDRKHKYVKRKGKFVPYRSKRDRSDPIKIWFWKCEPMSIEGYYKWARKFRAKVVKKVYKFGIRVDVFATRLSDPKSIKALVIDVLGYEGEWLLMGFSHGKNKFHVKPVKLCRIKILKTPTGLKAFVSETWRLSRYWFWKKDSG